MKKSRIFPVLLAFIMLVTCTLTPTARVNADGDPTLTVATVEGNPGDEVEVVLEITNNPGITVALFELHYDQDITCLKIEDKELLWNGKTGKARKAADFTPSGEYDLIDPDETEYADYPEEDWYKYILNPSKDAPNPVTLYWDDGENNYADDGELVVITFKISDTATSGIHNVWVTADPGRVYKAGTKDGSVKDEDITFTFVDGGINVVGGSEPTHEHTYGEPSYEWAEDYSTCKATVTCTSDECTDKVLSETVTSTSAVTTPATCEGKGKTTYTATFTDTHFTTQTKEVENINALGHTYGTPSYEWAEDYSTCTATATCTIEDCTNKTVTETVNTTSAVTTPATFDSMGTTTYTATFTKNPFTTQTKDVENIEKLTHHYGTPVYAWADDGKSCTATISCTDEGCTDGTVTEEATVENGKITSAVKTPATCEAKGTTTYTATFQNSLFTAQTKDVEDIEKVDHSYTVAEPEYDWAYDASSCTAKIKCDNCDYVLIEVTTNIKHESSEADCENAAKTVHTATFENKVFETQKWEEYNGNSLGHDYNEPQYSWSQDNKTCNATTTCKRCNSNVSEDGTVTNEVTKEVSCVENGEILYTATFTKVPFTKQTKTEVVNKLGHIYETVEYKWSDDYTGCTASATCTRCHDDASTISQPANVTITKTKEPTCEDKGETTYTATFTDTEHFQNQTNVVANIDALGHSYGTPVYTWSEDGKTSCTATVSCTRNGCNHSETGTATITSAEKTPATCETMGTTTYTASFQNSLFTTQTSDVVDIPALGHDLGEVTYTWEDDGSKCTASATCKRTGCGEVVTEEATVANGKITSAVKLAATCEAKGTTTYTATFENTQFGVKTKDVEDIAKLGHSFGTPTYSWSTDYSECTGTVACTRQGCTHTESQTVTSVLAGTTAPTCEAAGTATYTASFTDTRFASQSKTVNTDAALGHDYGTATPLYSWSADGKQCIASITCTRDNCNHSETEIATISSAEKTPATCVSMGTTTYTATFQNSLFTTQTKDVTDISALGHSFGTPVYTWTEDFDQCTATATCTRSGCTEKITETVNTSISGTVAPTCENKGTTTYTATFQNSMFEAQSRTVETADALGHNYGTPSYTWTNDGKSCTATVVCTREGCESTISETVTTVGTVKTPAKAEEKGTTTYTATFQNSVFTVQTKDVDDIPELGHNYGTPVYTWTEDGKQCTATVNCTDEGCTKVITETVTAVGSVKTAAKCDAKGITTYTATFTNGVFSAQSKDVEDIAALGHAYGTPAYSWSEDGKKCTATVSCTRTGCPDTITETVDTTGTVTIAATCEAKGTTTYTATFTNALFSAQTKNVEDIAALGHEYGTVAYTWTNDGKECTATVKCTRTDCPKEITEKATITSAVKTAATTEAKGITTYTATFTNSLFSTQTKDVEDIDKLPVNNDSGTIGTDYTNSGSGNSGGSGNNGGSGSTVDNSGSGTVVVPGDNTNNNNNNNNNNGNTDNKDNVVTNADGSTTTKEVVENKDGSTTTTAVTEYADGSKSTAEIVEKKDGTTVTTETTVNADGSKSTAETTQHKDGTLEKTETTVNADGFTTTTETKQTTDLVGTKTTTVAEESSDGSKVSTEIVEKRNGAYTATSVEEKADGTVIETEITKANAKAPEKKTETTKNENGEVVKEVTETTEKSLLATTVTTTIKDDAGTEISVVETAYKNGKSEKVTTEVAANGDVTVITETKNVDGSSASLSATTSADGGIEVVEKTVGKQGKATEVSFSVDAEAVAAALVNNEPVELEVDKVSTKAKTATVGGTIDAQGTSAVVRTVKKGSIANNKNLKSVAFESSINKFEKNIFKKNSKLKTIKIKIDSLEDAKNLVIDKGAFAGLKKVKIVVVTKSDEAYKIVKEKIENSGIKASVKISKSSK